MSIAILIPFRGTKQDKSRLRKDFEEKFVEDLLNDMMQHVINEVSLLEEAQTIYLLTKKEDINFIFCYNGSMDIKEKIINISKNHKGINETKTIFKDKSNYYFSVLNSSEIYNLIAECLKNGNKDKQKFIGLIKEKRMILG